MMLKEFVQKNIKWFGQNSLWIKNNNISIFIDPYKIQKKLHEKADFVLITHSHFDHLCCSSIESVADENTKFFAPSDCIEKLHRGGFEDVTEVAPFQTLNINEFAAQTFPMYNIRKTKYHPRSNNWVGYFFTFGDIKVYITGDTEHISEHKDINTDIIFLPLGQVYTMDSIDEAIDVVLDTKAKLAIPVHYGLYEGTEDDAQIFCQKLISKNIEAFTLQKGL